MAEILITKPGVLNQRDKALLRKSGVIVVEADSPADVKMVSAERGEISASGMLYACLKAISKDGWTDNVAHNLPKIMLEVLEAERAALTQTKDTTDG